MKTLLANFYLEFLNDFLTIERYAEYNDVSISECQILINLGRDFHNQRTTK